MQKKNKIYIGSDHAGFSLKTVLIEQLLKVLKTQQELDWIDCGTLDESRTDYPQHALSVAKRVSEEGAKGILICGSGIGMSIVANKVKHVRAAVVWDVTSARLSRQHNDANILCLGSRLLGPELVLDICRVWLSTPFEGGRHAERLKILEKLEKESYHE